MPSRRPLHAAAAVSFLAFSAAGCASTPSASAPSVKPATTAASKGPQTAATNLPPPTSIASELQTARALRAQGHLPEALRALAQLVLVAPDDPRVISEYGKVLVQLGRSDDAIAFLKHAVELRADDWTVYSALGVAYDQNDDRRNAKDAYDRALALHPKDATVLNNYAVSRMLAGDLDAAQRLLQQAQTTSSNNPKVSANLQLLAQIRARRAAVPTKSVAAGNPSATAPTSTQARSAAESKSIVMQQVPVDPQAGKIVAANSPKPSSPTAKQKVVKTVKGAAKPPPVPALRTAAQGE
ncbi:MAG: tetratricopeptide repeat protein [Rhizomicrobium sp.]